jgi:DNA replication protein DnaC
VTRLEAIQRHFRTLRMPTAVQIVAETMTVANKENWSLETFLTEILEQEIEGRHQRRIERLKKGSGLPVDKTLTTFDQERLPLRLRRLLPQLCTGEFVDQAENLLVFGLPGRGKTQPDLCPKKKDACNI